MQTSPREKRQKSQPQSRAVPRTDGNQHSFTSFKPLSPEKPQGSFSFSKLFQWKSSEPPITKGGPPSTSSSPLRYQSAGTSSGASPRYGSPALEHKKIPRTRIPRSWSSPRFPRRQGSASPTVQSRQLPQGYLNLTALLKRLTVVADSSKGEQLPQSYFKQYWMPDENCKECYECGEKFNTFRRRHHCRLCGQIFCYRCCNIEIPGEIMGYAGGLRVCTYCDKIFQTYTQSPDMMSNLEQLQADIQAVAMETEYTGPHSSMNTMSLSRSSQDDDTVASRKTSANSVNSVVFEKLEQMEARQTGTLQSVRSPFDAFGVCAAEADILKQGSLRDLWHTIMSQRSGLELQSHRFRLKTYQNCLVASDLVDWLINHEKAITRSQAVVIGQALLEGGWLEPVPNTRYAQSYVDEYALYQPGPTASKDQLQAGNPRHSLFHRGSNPNEESSDGMSDNNDDDESAPQWFRQLQGYESGEELDTQEYVKADPATPASILNVPKISRIASVKLLDLDVAVGTTEEKEDSELSLKVNLDHFREGSDNTKGQGTENQGPTLALTTDVPPPPLEQYVYNEGYPISSLRSNNKKPSEPVVLGTSAEDVLKGALMAKRIGVNRPKPSDIEKLRDDNDERLAMERICEARYIHMVHLVEQLLQDAGLSLDWQEVILPLVEEISDKVSPDVRNDDDMDVRHYVKFKKIPGGHKSDCQVVWGVGFTKNISHKKMCSSFNNPKILLLSCAIDFQRKENRLASLDSLVLQEYNFLKNFVARVAALRPNVLLVEKTVSRLAQDMLLQHGITLALNVKPEVIERVARCTKAAVLRSMEQLSRPQLGTCQHFGVQKYLLKNGESKTLMFLDGCPPELGCTVTLRGGNGLVLAKVKKIVQFLTYVSHGQKLETAFLMDEFALPEDPSHLFCDSSKSNSGEENNTSEDDQNTAKIFQKLLDQTVLSSSPYVKYPLPYLLTAEGSKCAIRSLLPKDIYWSARLKGKRKNHQLTEEDLDEFEPPLSKIINLKGIEMLPPHPLVLSKVVVNTSSQFIQGVIADFRSQGGRIQLKRSRNSNEERRKSKWLLLDVDDGRQQRVPSVGSAGGRDNPTVERDKVFTSPTKVVPTSPVHFNKQVDCLDPSYHQRIAVLFSSYSSESNNSPRPCISPWAVFMEFYGRNDITLGGFLERYCFRPSYVCPNPNCDVPMVDHVRYFAHGNGSVYINMKNLESPIPGFHHTILTWSWCKECKQVTPIVPLSFDAWALSFAKYIELRFYGDQYSRRASVEPCGHSLHRHHFQYFAFANMVASFKYREIKLFETAIPLPSISVKKDVREASYWVRDVHAISDRADSVFGSILDRLDVLKGERIDSHTPDRDSKLIQFASQLDVDKGMFSERVQVVTKKVNVLQGLQNPSVVSSYDHLDKQDQIALGYVISDSLNGLKRILCEIVETWNNRLQEFIQAEKKKSNKTPLGQRDSKSGEKIDNSLQNLSTKSVDKEDIATPVASPSHGLPVSSPSPQMPGAEGPENIGSSDIEPSELETNSKKNTTNHNEDFNKIDIQEKQVESDSNKNDGATESVDSHNESKSFVRGHRRIHSSPPIITITHCTPCGNEGLMRSVSDSNVNETHAQKENTSLSSTSLSHSSSNSEGGGGLDSSTLTKRTYGRLLSVPNTLTAVKQTDNVEQESPVMSTDGTPVLRRRDKMKNIISSFLPGSTFQPIASSFPSHEHHLLPAGENVLVVVNEKEPSSIIAYALSTKEYNHRLCEIQVSLVRLAKGAENGQKHPKGSENDDESSRFEGSVCVESPSVITVDDSNGEFVNVEIREAHGIDEDELDSSTAHVEIIQEQQVVQVGRRKSRNTIDRSDRVKFSKGPSQEDMGMEDGRKQQCSEQQANYENRCQPEFGFQPKDVGKDRPLEFHIQMQFSYNVCRFYCNAYYAEQFRNLRKDTFEDGEEKYIRSLAHCVVWRARGGKSGSTFSKSFDDRFVLKQMSRLELQSFVEFAPHYFQYMNKAITEKRSTLLAKIFGVYRIGFKNTQTNTTMRQDVLVMENLFYDRKIDKTFDLKGSMRSRYVQVSSGENDVLMDENLLELIRESPIFIRPHSKAVLSKAIHNDTEFLAQHMVMDYSLLVGIDEIRSELVIGIIDFIRTFTWDKKLEMYVKSSGILGGQGKMPTVVSPELYRTRFTEAMHRYFLMVPDKWTGLGNDID